MAGELVLIVDDSPVNLKLARLLLEGEGYRVKTANDAEEALELLETLHPRLILMDVQLPGMDGLELTRRIRADLARRRIIVFAVSAYAMKGDEEKALAAGCDAYVTKPIDGDALLATMREHLVKG